MTKAKLKLVDGKPERPDVDAFIKSCNSRSATHGTGANFGEKVKAYLEHLESQQPAKPPVYNIGDIDSHIAALQLLREKQINPVKDDMQHAGEDDVLDNTGEGGAPVAPDSNS